MSPEQAIAKCQQIIDDIDSLDENVQAKAQDFFESVSKRAGEIAETIETQGRVSSAQVKAIDNMHSGVRRWFRED